MTLQQIRYFTNLAQTLNMRQSAEQLYISQPSLSISIRNLEEELDITLFDRIGHRLRLTLAGREFLIHCRKIIRETDNSILHMHRLAEKHRKKISLGCVAPVLSRYLPRQMNAFRSLPENRDVEFEIEEATTAELIEKLHNGLLDFVICTEQEDDSLNQYHLMETPLVLISPLSEYSECDTNLTWEKIENLSLISYPLDSAMNFVLDNLWDQEDIHPSIRYRMPNEGAILSMVESGFGFAIIPQTDDLKNYQVDICPLPSGNYSQRISLTTLKGQNCSGASLRFTEYLKNQRI